MKKILDWLNGLVGSVWLWIWFVVSTVNGIIAHMQAESIMHQIYAELQMLQACIVLCALYIVKDRS